MVSQQSRPVSIQNQSLTDCFVFQEYEITCDHKEKSLAKNVCYLWRVWHRYSEFQVLDQELRKLLQWKMKPIEFPAKKSFASGTRRCFYS